MRVHPEIVEKFNELVRWHFDAAREGREVWQLREDMRKADAKEQAALLKATCEIKVVVRHSPSCQTVAWFMMPCSCNPTKEIRFLAPEKYKTDKYMFSTFGRPPERLE